MRAGVGHRAAAQILDQIFQFRPGERVVGLHRVAADGLGHGVLAQPRQIHLAPGGAAIRPRGRAQTGAGRRPSRTAAARRAETSARRIRSSRRRAASARPVARAENCASRGGNSMVSGSSSFCDGAEPFCSMPVQHLLEQNPLVRRVLVEQHQSAVGFQHDIEFADDADEPQRDVEQRRGRWKMAVAETAERSRGSTAWLRRWQDSEAGGCRRSRFVKNPFATAVVRRVAAAIREPVLAARGNSGSDCVESSGAALTSSGFPMASTCSALRLCVSALEIDFGFSGSV